MVGDQSLEDEHISFFNLSCLDQGRNKSLATREESGFNMFGIFVCKMLYVASLGIMLPSNMATFINPVLCLHEKLVTLFKIST